MTKEGSCGIFQRVDGQAVRVQDLGADTVCGFVGLHQSS
jgi:hypothetical protein